MVRVEAGIMRWVVLWDTACKFNAVISNKSFFNRLITSASNVIKILSYLVVRGWGCIFRFLSHYTWSPPGHRVGTSIYTASYPLRDRLEREGKLDNSIHVIILYPFLQSFWFLYRVYASAGLCRLSAQTSRGWLCSQLHANIDYDQELWCM